MEKTTTPQPEKSSHRPVPARRRPSATPPLSHPLSNLQRAIGNQAVGRLLQSGAIQRKLRLSQSGDAQEREADAIAEKVVAASTSPKLQRKCTCGSGESCAECEEQKTQAIHRKPKSPARESSSSAVDVTNSLVSGQPLGPGIRQSMESRFGYDFSSIRIHTGSEAANRAQSVNARAFTFGRNIVFGAGEYAPETPDGKRLLAHELTHSIQQDRAGTNCIQRWAPEENEEDEFQEAVAKGKKKSGKTKGDKKSTKPPDPCPKEKRDFFNWLDASIGPMATELSVDKALMFTMAAREGGWTKDALEHNMPLQNPFGVNKIGHGKAVGNIKYKSLKDAIDYWKKTYGSRVKGAQTADDFVNGLQHPKRGQPYNSINPNYESEFKSIYKSVLKFMKLCDIKERKKED